MIQIQVQELRIGNVVMDMNNGNKVVTIEHGYDLWDGDFAPIDLTPEILERCGFDGRDFIELDTYAFIFIEKDNVCVFQTEYETEVARTKLPHIKYLHQLQNLYYMLKGTELTINLT